MVAALAISSSPSARPSQRARPKNRHRARVRGGANPAVHAESHLCAVAARRWRTRDGHNEASLAGADGVADFPAARIAHTAHRARSYEGLVRTSLRPYSIYTRVSPAAAGKASRDRKEAPTGDTRD